MASLSYTPTTTLIELLGKADPQMVLRVMVYSSTKLALGADPTRPTMIIDLAKEAVAPFLATTAAVPKNEVASALRHATASNEDQRVERKSGDYFLICMGRRMECGSLRQLLAEGLKALENQCPGTLERLSSVGNSKRIVSRDPRKLFGKEHLAAQFASQLGGGWWYGHNNSSAETKKWLKRGCEISGLAWGTEFQTSL
jgi:hypothetical protein